MDSPDPVAAERFPEIRFSVVGNHEFVFLIGEERIVPGAILSIH